MGTLNSYKNIVDKRHSLEEEIRKINESIAQAESELEDICDIEDSDDRNDEEAELNQIITTRSLNLEDLESQLEFHDASIKYVEHLIEKKTNNHA